jgi:hypothetical protein
MLSYGRRFKKPEMSVQQCKDEIVAKRAKLQELRRQRALPEQEKSHRKSVGGSFETLIAIIIL